MKTTVADIIAEAGVSRATFYELFTDREDCFQAAYRPDAELVAAVMAAELERVRQRRAATAGPPRPGARRLPPARCTTRRRSPACSSSRSTPPGPALIEQRRASLERFVDIVAETHRGETGVLGTEAEPALRGPGLRRRGQLARHQLRRRRATSTGLLDLHEPLMRLAAQITGQVIDKSVFLL